jgi:hypothetical protein
VALHGVLGDEQAVRDLPSGLAADDEFDYLFLARAEIVRRHPEPGHLVRLRGGNDDDPLHGPARSRFGLGRVQREPAAVASAQPQARRQVAIPAASRRHGAPQHAEKNLNWHR